MPPTQQVAWSEFCHRVGGMPIARDSGFHPAFQVVRRDWIITADRGVTVGGVSHLRLRAPFVNWSGFRFALHRRGRWSQALARMGQLASDRDWPVSWTEFGVDCADTDLLRTLLGFPGLAGRINHLTPPLLGIRDDEGWSGPEYPRGVDVLLLHGYPADRSPEILAEYFHLFVALIEAVNALHGHDPEDEASLARLLEAPSGRIQQDGLDLWDGDVLRIWAAEQIAQRNAVGAREALTRLLRDHNPVVRAEVLKVLERLKDRETIPHILLLLADEHVVGSRTMSELAEGVLRRLGAREWTTRFFRVIAGEESGAALAGPYRESFVQALMATLESPYPDRTRHAAFALADLHAVEAMPAIRRAIQRHPYHMLEAALVPAIRRLEADAALPRPASGLPAEHGSLPIPSGAAQHDPRVLPRPAAPAGENDPTA